MKTKIVYVVTSDESDVYLEQALLSVFSLRKHNPNAYVELVVDQDTDATITGKREEILKYIDNKNVVNVPEEYNKVCKSRWLKTCLRQHVKGDFLFIDCDTVICASLDKIDEFECNVGMVADLNDQRHLWRQKIIERCEKAGFIDVKGQLYFNSGIIYAKDTPIAHQLYEEWYRLWQKSEARGIMYDQPALCKANINLGYPVKELSGIWNCQFKSGRGYLYLNEALILHYFSLDGQRKNYYQTRLFEYVKEKGFIDSVVENIIRHPRTIFYFGVKIKPYKLFEFFSFEQLYYFCKYPIVYRIITLPFYLTCSIRNLIKRTGGRVPVSRIIGVSNNQ